MRKTRGIRKALAIIMTIAAGVAGLTAPGPRVSAEVTPVPAPAPAHTISINDVTVHEGAGTATFALTLSPPPDANAGTTYTVYTYTTDGTSSLPNSQWAFAGFDYVDRTEVVTWPAGTSEATRTFNVQILQDGIPESTEGFSLFAQNPLASGCRGFRCTVPTVAVADGIGEATIVDGDRVLTLGGQTQPATTKSDCTFDVALDPETNGPPITVNWAATGATSLLAGPTSGQLSFNSGSTGIITLDVVKQPKNKLSNARVTVTLSEPVGAKIGTGSATCTIKKKARRGGQ